MIDLVVVGGGQAGLAAGAAAAARGLSVIVCEKAERYGGSAYFSAGILWTAPDVSTLTSLLPDGGTGYERPEWPDEAVDDLARRFRASPFAAGVDDPDDLLSSLLWFGAGYGPGDPMRWSPTAVEILLLDWIPRKIVAEVEHLTRGPELLRAFIRFCHHERGCRPGLRPLWAAGRAGLGKVDLRPWPLRPERRPP